MLRWMTPFLAAMFAVGTAAAQDSGAAAAPGQSDSPAVAKPAEPPAAAKPEAAPAATTKPAPSPAGTMPTRKQAATRRAAIRAAGQLPPGLPRAPYNYRTTVAPRAAPLYVRRGRAVVVEQETIDVPLISGAVDAFVPRVFNAPLLPGSSTLPGYYGTRHSYTYDGDYYGSPTFWGRLPYACGVYGYC
jgi:hypothetical protein